MSVTPIENQTKVVFPRLILPPHWYQNWHWPSVWLWTGGLVVAGLVLLPAFYLLLRALQASSSLLTILTKASTITAFGNTILLAGTVTLASIAIALPIAWLTVCTDLPGKRVWAVVAALPLVLPSYVAAYLLVSILGPKGMMQQLLFPITGIERFPNLYGFWGAFLALTLMSYPYLLLTVRAGLKRLDPSLVEAARSLGYSPWQAFWRITLPQLRPSIVAGSLLVILYVLRDFGAVTMLRYDTFTRLIYLQYRSFMDRSLAATLALMLIGLTVVVLYLEKRTRGQAQYARRSAGAARLMRLVALGRGKWLAWGFLGTVVMLALGMPALSLIYWLGRGIQNQLILTNIAPAAANSLTISLIAAILTSLAALPVAILAVRHSNKASQWIEQISYAGHALPGIVIALALVFLGAHYLPALYQTLPMLLVGYLILFVPQAVGTIRASLLQLPSSLEEAGRSLGLHPLAVFRRITFPLLRPGLLAGAALVFLTCMKELPATLLLSPTGFHTLASSVWGNISEAFFAQAAVPALLLVLLSSIPLAILTLLNDE